MIAIPTAPMAEDADARAWLQGELLQCWLARAVAQVAERAAAVRLVTSVAFASVRPRDANDDHHVTQTLARCVATFATISHQSGRARGAGAHICVECEDIPRVDNAEQVARHRTGSNTEKKMLVVVVTRALDQRLSESESASLSNAGFDLALVVARAGDAMPDAVDASRSSPRWPWACSLVDLAHNPDDEDALLFLQHPLDQLDIQCGWRIALEVLSWIAPPSSSDSTAPGSTSEGVEQELTPLFTTAGQLPFQLLLLLLRWSFFHPSVARLLGTKLKRQLELTPASRTRCDVWNAQQLGRQLWRHLYPEEPGAATQVSLSTRTDVSASSLGCLTAATARDQRTSVSASLPSLDRLSKCQLWDTQKQFYLDRGIQAWSSGVVPFGVSSSSFIAAAYASR